MAVRDNISRKLRRRAACRNTRVLSGVSRSDAETPSRLVVSWRKTRGSGTYDSGKLSTQVVSEDLGSQSYATATNASTPM